MKKTTTIVAKVKNPEHRDRVNKAELETMEFHVIKVGMNVGKAITNARVERKWKRENLARAMNMPVSVVADHENGKAVYDPKILTKFERALNIHLERPKSNDKK